MPPKKKNVTKLVAKVQTPDVKPVAVPKVKDVVKKVELVEKAKPIVAKVEPVAKVKESECKLNAEQRFNLIQEQSYLIAEKDGFSKHPDYYWHEAEAKIEAEYK